MIINEDKSTDLVLVVDEVGTHDDYFLVVAVDDEDEVIGESVVFWPNEEVDGTLVALETSRSDVVGLVKVDNSMNELDDVVVRSEDTVLKPFAGYEDWDECVADNQDKDDPEAFCGWLYEQSKKHHGIPEAHDPSGGAGGDVSAAGAKLGERADRFVDAGGGIEELPPDEVEELLEGTIEDRGLSGTDSGVEMARDAIADVQHGDGDRLITAANVETFEVAAVASVSDAPGETYISKIGATGTQSGAGSAIIDTIVRDAAAQGKAVTAAPTDASEGFWGDLGFEPGADSAFGDSDFPEAVWGLDADKVRMMADAARSAQKKDGTMNLMGMNVMLSYTPPAMMRHALAMERGVDPDDIHLTLSYLGKAEDIDEDSLAALPALIRRECGSLPKAKARIVGHGVFENGDERAYHAIVDSEWLPLIRSMLDSATYSAGITPYDEQVGRNYKPHITLRYLDPDEEEEPSWKLKDPIDFEIDHVNLVVGDQVVRTFYLEDEYMDDMMAMSEGGAELTGPIVRKDSAKQVAYAAVLVPGEPDSDGDVLSEEKIEDVAHRFMERYGNIDKQHTLVNVDAAVVESYITPQDQVVRFADEENVILPKGSWIMATHIRDPEQWQEVMSGDIAGYSIMGVRNSASVKSDGDTATKRTMLADLGDDWVATHVSLVDKPAVPKAKFFALKSHDTVATEQRPEGKMAKIRRALGMKADPSMKEGRQISEANLAKLRDALNALEELNTALSELVAVGESERKNKSIEEELDMDEAQLKELIQDVVNGAVEPLHERIAALEGKPYDEEEDEEEKAEKASTEPVVEEDPVEEPAEEPEPEEEPTAEESEADAEAGTDEDEALEDAKLADEDSELEEERAARKDAERELEELRAELEARAKSGTRKGIVGQDGDAPTAPHKTHEVLKRDALGRRVRR